MQATIEEQAVENRAAIPVSKNGRVQEILGVVHCCFGGRRVVIFSGGPADATDTVLEEIRGIHAGGGFGSIIGRNSFQRKKADALKLLGDIMAIYSTKIS